MVLAVTAGSLFLSADSGYEAGQCSREREKYSTEKKVKKKTQAMLLLIVAPSILWLFAALSIFWLL